MSQNNPRSQRGNSGRRGGGSGRRPGRKSSAPSGPAPEPLQPTDNPPEIESFTEFDLHPEIQAAIAAMGIVTPTPIQALAIGPVLAGKDVIAKAETGTGKTLAFGAPMISMIDPERASVLGLVLCPTRELADQVKVVLEQLGESRGIKVALIVGGEPAGPQVAALQAGAQVVVGTPGRVIDLYEQKFLSFPWTEFVVLDEADEMFEIGFVDDVKKIMKFTPDERQTLLFSATFPPALLRLARDHTKEPAEIATASGVKTVDNIEQVYIRLGSDERPLALIRMIERSEPEDVFLVFCERRTDVERLMRRLERLPFSVKALHGGYDQSARFRVMSAFRTGEVKCLVATDVASRGLDVNHVTRVVNYSPPRSITDYTHRIGRTGRAGREGHAVTFVAPEGNVRWNSLMRDATWDIPEVEAPGSRFQSAPPANRDDSEREERPRRKGRERDAAPEEDREERAERPRRPRSEERERPPLRERDSREDFDADRDRPAARESRRSESAPPAASPRPTLRRAQSTDAPVELPGSGQVRQRDPNDPPRRVRMTREMRERLERESKEAKRGEEEDGRDRGRRDRTRSRRTREEEAPASNRDADREDAPRERSRSRENREARGRSRSFDDTGEAPRERNEEDRDLDPPRRERSRVRRERGERPRERSNSVEPASSYEDAENNGEGRDLDAPTRGRARSRSDRDSSSAARENEARESADGPRDTEDSREERPRSRGRRARNDAPREPQDTEREDSPREPRRTRVRADRSESDRDREDQPRDSNAPRREATRSRAPKDRDEAPRASDQRKPERAERPASGGGFGSGL